MTEADMENRQPGSLRELLRQLDAQGITDYRRYSRVRRFLSFKAREKNLPISGSFELTPLCNLDCRMCYVHLQGEQMRGARLRTVDEWKDIVRQAFDAGMMYATLTGGECLTYPGFRELYGFLREKGVEVAILSNGLLMDAEMVEFFRRNPPASIQVTLYGASEEAYERVTGTRAFARVLGNLRRIQEAELPLRVAVTPNAYMTDGEALIQLLYDEGFPFSVNAGLMQPREETGRAVADADLDAYVGILKRARALRGEPVEPECDPESLPDPASATSDQKKGVRCGAGAKQLFGGLAGADASLQHLSLRGRGRSRAGLRGGLAAYKPDGAQLSPVPPNARGCYYESVCKHCVAEHAASAKPGHASPRICQWGKRMVAEGLLIPQQAEEKE